MAAAIGGFDPANPIHRAILYSTSLQEAWTAFGSLSGEAHASVVTSAYGNAALVQGSILNRLRTPFATAPTATVPAAYAADRPGAAAQVAPVPYPVLDPRRFALWGEGFGAWGSARTGSQAAGIDTTTGGFILGAEAVPEPGYRIGIAGGFTRTSLDITERDSEATDESVFGALYGAADWGALSLRLGMTYAGHDIDVTRRISIPGFVDRAGASYGGSTAQAFGELGHRFDVAGIALEPFAGASVVRVRTDGFAETGGAAALTGSGRSHDLGMTTLGVRVETALGTALPLTFRGLLGWRWAYGDVEPAALLAFRDGGTGFATAGLPVDRNALLAEAGLGWQASEAISLELGYRGQIGPRAQEHTLKGNFTWKF
jgi:outer membrane autotransporter protein